MKRRKRKPETEGWAKHRDPGRCRHYWIGALTACGRHPFVVETVLLKEPQGDRARAKFRYRNGYLCGNCCDALNSGAFSKTQIRLFVHRFPESARTLRGMGVIKQ